MADDTDGIGGLCDRLEEALLERRQSWNPDELREIVGDLLPVVAPLITAARERDRLLAAVEGLAEELPERLRGDGPCSRCGTADNPVWFTDNVFWNAVVRSAPLPWIDGEGDGFLCPNCFIRLADERGYYVTGWRIVPEFHQETHTERAARLRAVAAAAGEAT